MNVNGVFSSPYINSLFMGRGKAKPETAPAKVLFDWFAKQRDHRRDFVEKSGYSDGRITNWKTRGIPLAELARVAALIGLTYEEYLVEAGVQPPRFRSAVQPNIEEAHAIRRLRKALPAYRAYVLSLALMEDHQKQQLFLDIMREHVPNKAVEEAYGDAPHVAARKREKENP